MATTGKTLTAMEDLANFGKMLRNAPRRMGEALAQYGAGLAAQQNAILAQNGRDALVARQIEAVQASRPGPQTGYSYPAVPAVPTTDMDRIVLADAVRKDRAGPAVVVPKRGLGDAISAMNGGQGGADVRATPEAFAAFGAANSPVLAVDPAPARTRLADAIRADRAGPAVVTAPRQAATGLTIPSIIPAAQAATGVTVPSPVNRALTVDANGNMIAIPPRMDMRSGYEASNQLKSALGDTRTELAARAAAIRGGTDGGLRTSPVMMALSQYIDNPQEAAAREVRAKDFAALQPGGAEYDRLMKFTRDAFTQQRGGGAMTGKNGPVDTSVQRPYKPPVSTDTPKAVAPKAMSMGEAISRMNAGVRSDQAAPVDAEREAMMDQLVAAVAAMPRKQFIQFLAAQPNPTAPKPQSARDMAMMQALELIQRNAAMEADPNKANSTALDLLMRLLGGDTTLLDLNDQENG